MSGRVTSTGEIRIIGGAFRRRRLVFPALPGVRPTPDRVRETLFNWLGQDLQGQSCLDLFAGSGALGFEAASRGASRVVMVEQDRRVFQALKANAAMLAAGVVEPRGGDALEFLSGSTELFDIVFLDPPFAAADWGEWFDALASHVAADGQVYCERGGTWETPAGWQVHREARAGQVHYQLLRRAGI